MYLKRVLGHTYLQQSAGIWPACSSFRLDLSLCQLPLVAVNVDYTIKEHHLIKAFLAYIVISIKEILNLTGSKYFILLCMFFLSVFHSLFFYLFFFSILTTTN